MKSKPTPQEMERMADAAISGVYLAQSIHHMMCLTGDEVPLSRSLDRYPTLMLGQITHGLAYALWWGAEMRAGREMLGAWH